MIRANPHVEIYFAEYQEITTDIKNSHFQPGYDGCRVIKDRVPFSVICQRYEVPEFMNIEYIMSQMTLEEKAGMLSGEDFWRTKAVKRLGVPSLLMSDGPHGLRKQQEGGDHLGINESIKAVCFPAGCALASSFDKELVERLGMTLGNECQAEGVGVILGPAVNIKRSPLCGRNFEYFSEDPLLASRMAKSFINGVQSRKVGTSIKHFLANNQEYRRMTSSSQVDARTLREIYLAAFEEAVTEAKPWTVMCSYNRINGVYAAENKTYLTDVLRAEWGFDGFVVSDWGAVNHRVRDLEAGLDLEMPSSNGVNDNLIVKAVNAGDLAIEVVDQAVRRILTVISAFEDHRDSSAVFDRDADHEEARSIASQCMVLLKNEDILPLSKQSSTAFIGYFAKHPRYQGGGSSHINASRVESALEYAGGDTIRYAQGYGIGEGTDDQILFDEALKLARNVDTVVVFAGLPDSYESEGFDRAHLRLPDNQNRLIEALADVNTNIVVVLHNGSPVQMPWIDSVKGVLEAYLGGQAIGGATVQCLFGDVNPSGRLAETFPLRLEDNPSYLNFPGERDLVEYREGVFVGYRYYDAKNMNVLFPFGHGLSYTTFEYSDLRTDSNMLRDGGELKVSVDITNTGNRAGREVAQLYIAPCGTQQNRPVRQLKGFEKIMLQPGETKSVHFHLSERDFSIYRADLETWYAPSGEYEIQIGKSSRDIVLFERVTVNSANPRMTFTLDTPVGDILKDPVGKSVFADVAMRFMKIFVGEEESTALGEGTSGFLTEMARNMPLRGVVTFGGIIGYDELQDLLDAVNQVEG